MRDVPQPTIFTVDQARAHGWTASALRHAVTTGRLVRLRRGVYCDAASSAAPALHAAAVTLTRRGAVVSHRSAAALHGVPMLGAVPRLPELTVAPRTGANLPGVHLHRASLPPADVVCIDGVDVTGPARTAIDIARHHPALSAVAVMDNALHRGLVCDDDLARVIDECRCWPGIRRARAAYGLADGRSESALESVSRLRMTQLAIPAPALQTTIFDEFGRLVARVDFYWDEFGVYGEADGRAKYVDRQSLWAEKEREDELGRLGLVAARWGWDDAWRDGRRMRSRLASAFERGAARDRSGFPRLWSL
jgi:Transcriptional regulator, AbiEi antitoxin